MNYIKIFFLLAVLLISIDTVAENTCIKKRVAVRNGSVNLGKAVTLRDGACAANEKTIASSTGIIDGYARFNGNGTLVAFAGQKVSSVQAQETVVPGVVQIHFNGDFSDRLSASDSEANRSKVVTFASAVAVQAYTILPFVVAASASKIILGLNLYNAANNLAHIGINGGYSAAFLLTE
jgi:hypothetical protein